MPASPRSVLLPSGSTWLEGLQKKAALTGVT